MHIDHDKMTIKETIPLTRPTGKIRVKTRCSFHDYGQPFSSRSSPFTKMNYVERQIAYDTDEKPHDFSPPYAGRAGTRFLTELSYYFYQFCLWGILEREKVENLLRYLEDVGESELVSNRDDCRISRTHPRRLQIAGVPFSGMTLEYPQLAYRFGDSEILVEITVREKQRAVGVQPMVYFCIPISQLEVSRPLVGRIAEKNECAQFTFSSANFGLVEQTMKIFGLLSDRHRDDILRIVGSVLETG